MRLLILLNITTKDTDLTRCSPYFTQPYPEVFIDMGLSQSQGFISTLTSTRNGLGWEHLFVTYANLT